jgi:hypothetical protein
MRQWADLAMVGSELQFCAKNGHSIRPRSVVPKDLKQDLARSAGRWEGPDDCR